MNTGLVYFLMVLTVVSASILPLPVYPDHTHQIQSLYHAQDVLGQYAYGYATPTSTKNEAKSLDGVTRGGYSYIDSNGLLQTVEYSSDPIHGFRVAASNLPVDLPEVAATKARHLAEFHAIQSERAQIAAQSIHYSNPVVVPVAAVSQVPLVPLPQPVQDLPEVVKARAEHLAAVELARATGGAIPQPVQDLPEVVKARAEHLAAVEATKLRDATWNQGIALSPVPVQLNTATVPVKTSYVSHSQAVPVGPVVSYLPAVSLAPVSQYHLQDTLGQYSYGYVGPLSAKTETKTADGITRGGYSYIDSNGVLQTVSYMADPINGFRVSATNLPVPPPLQPSPVVQIKTGYPIDKSGSSW